MGVRRADSVTILVSEQVRRLWRCLTVSAPVRTSTFGPSDPWSVCGRYVVRPPLVLLVLFLP